ncbi:MAG: hypothetical protein ACTSUE_15920 [Promethearchaeota archaeon]
MDELDQGTLDVPMDWRSIVKRMQDEGRETLTATECDVIMHSLRADVPDALWGFFSEYFCAILTSGNDVERKKRDGTQLAHEMQRKIRQYYNEL